MMTDIEMIFAPAILPKPGPCVREVRHLDMHRPVKTENRDVPTTRRITGVRLDGNVTISEKTLNAGYEMVCAGINTVPAVSEVMDRSITHTKRVLAELVKAGKLQRTKIPGIHAYVYAVRSESDEA